MEEVKAVSKDLGHEALEDKPGRSRTWMILLYPETEETGAHKRVLEETLDELDWNYCGRVHDKDDGVKEHHHVVVYFQNGRLKEDVARDLGIETRWLRRAHSQKRAMRYLCHKDNPEKYQYTPGEIYGTMADKAIAQCSKGDSKTEEDGVSKILELIDSWVGYIPYRVFLQVVLAEGVYSHYRRLGNSIFKLIEEHNADYTRRGKEKSVGAYAEAVDKARFEGFVDGYEVHKRQREQLPTL